MDDNLKATMELVRIFTADFLGHQSSLDLNLGVRSTFDVNVKPGLVNRAFGSAVVTVPLMIDLSRNMTTEQRMAGWSAFTSTYYEYIENRLSGCVAAIRELDYKLRVNEAMQERRIGDNCREWDAACREMNAGVVSCERWNELEQLRSRCFDCDEALANMRMAHDKLYKERERITRDLIACQLIKQRKLYISRLKLDADNRCWHLEVRSAVNDENRAREQAELARQRAMNECDWVEDALVKA